MTTYNTQYNRAAFDHACDIRLLISIAEFFDLFNMGGEL